MCWIDFLDWAMHRNADFPIPGFTVEPAQHSTGTGLVDLQSLVQLLAREKLPLLQNAQYKTIQLVSVG
jgi:hypothetical protein